MLSEIPKKLDKLKKKEINKEILRVGIIAELDAVSLYEQLATMTNKEEIRKVLLGIAKEEKTHVGEFQALLLKEDKEQITELERGKKEVDEILKKGLVFSKYFGYVKILDKTQSNLRFFVPQKSEIFSDSTL